MTTPLILVVNSSLATDPNQDVLGIIIFGFDFLLFTLLFIAISNRIADSKAAKVWPKLAPVINGTFHKGIGLTRPHLVGSYRGLPVRAYVRVSARSRWTFTYYFEIVTTLDTHGHSWELYYNQSPHAAHGWEVKTKDETLKQRLMHSGLLTLIPGWDYLTSVKYRGGKGVLLYRHQIYTRNDVPSPEAFQNQLTLLKKLAGITRQVVETPDAGNRLNQR